MSDTSANNKRIAKNTLMLYVRMLFMMAVSLYTSRVVLGALGVEDYGIYNVVGGVVAMFTMLSGSLSASISRFITFELGKQNHDRLHKVFCTSINVQLILILVLFLLLETVGLWFLNYKMVIPEERLHAANWVFQFSIITLAISLYSVPYNAAIIAHEKMSAFAYISLFDVFAKLLVAIVILANPFDRLIFYSLLILLTSLIQRMIYSWYCKRQFKECHYQPMFDISIIREIFGFAGWNFIGASSGVLRSQGINVLMNLYCGPVVNAARGVSVQVNNAVQQFSSSFTTALNPQITKHYASGDVGNSLSLVFRGARFSLYLYSFLAIPIIIETDTILNLWLSEVPIHTVAFVRLVMIYSMIESLSGTMTTLMLATGKIRNYQLLVGGLQLLHFPAAWFVLNFGFEPELTYVSAMAVALCCLVARLFMLNRMIKLPVREYLKEVFLNVVMVVTTAVIPPLIIKKIMSDGIIRLCLVIIVSMTALAVSMYIIGFSNNEKRLIADKISTLKHKICTK